MYEQQLTFKFFDSLPEQSKVYGRPKDQALLFQDVIPWPDPEINKEHYEIFPGGFLGDSQRMYNINKMFMREPLLQKNVDILTVGCSNSFGVGLPLDAIWPEMVSKKLNATYSNISVAGSSVMYQVINTLHYCQTFGNPKIILCMFPNFERSRLFVDNKSTRFLNEGEEVTGPMHIYTDRLIDKPKFLKLPVGKDDFITQSQAFYNNALFIFILEQYCNANNIKLIWTTWAHYADFDKMFKQTYKYYRSIDDGFYHDRVSRCWDHEKLKNKFPGLFDEGSDPHKHPGFHWHTHVYEFFINEINKTLS